VFGKVGMSFDQVELSTRPRKRIGTDEMWDFAEQV
jgi:threonyl-tRNA synthetase